MIFISFLSDFINQFIINVSDFDLFRRIINFNKKRKSFFIR
jgi:hypothetical protein